jgi:hypothetical protein
VALTQRIGGIEFPRIFRTFLKMAVASAVMGLAAHYSHVWLLSLFGEPTLLHRSVRVLGAIGIAMGVLALSAHLLRVEEFGAAMSRVMGRLRR